MANVITCPIQRHASSQGDAVAIYLSHNGASLSYAKLNSKVSAISLSQVPKGEVLAVIHNDPLTLLTMMFACLRQGIIFCPLNPIFSQQQLQQRCTQAGIRYYYGPSSIALTDVTPIDIHQPTQRAECKLTLAQACTLVFTSGSSGDAKAAQHSLGNHYYSALGSQQLIPFCQQDCWLLSLPLFHIGGIALVFRAFFAGGSIALGTKQIAQDLTHYPVTHASLVPTQVYRLLQQPDMLTHKSLRYVLVGGAALDNELLKQLANGPFKSFASYGLTEMSSQVASVELTPSSQQPLQYQVLPDREVEISKGEIILKGACLFMGYRQLGQLVAVDQRLGFASKDLGAIASRKLCVYGRKDNMFIAGGENVQPEQIEQALLSLPYIKGVIIVPIPDPEFGQVAAAFVDWKNTTQCQQLQQDSKQLLAPWQRPKHLLPWPQWQGLKPDRKALKQQAIAQLITEVEMAKHHSDAKEQ
ncbi:AMP-binding protein [Motilimonas cestriensis]|uniref:AMP-binding protein n=1 Tax=Motilimonas cestriensis TaxID=2742685 RepID=A0ABS8W6B1_9GAMM|nr:AMP-binding protein [Motilimonas cestriensis]MCE2594088.1 AMP-binding protein [Motilimonas cestriensis]